MLLDGCDERVSYEAKEEKPISNISRQIPSVVERQLIVISYPGCHLPLVMGERQIAVQWGITSADLIMLERNSNTMELEFSSTAKLDP